MAAEERGRGLALLFFLIILLLAIMPLPEFLQQKKEMPSFANLQENAAGKISVVPCAADDNCLPEIRQKNLSLFLFAKIDINSASFAELITMLKGVGTKKAKYLQQFFVFSQEDEKKRDVSTTEK